MQPVSGLEIELGLFGQSVLQGILFLVVYDLIRIVRRVFPHGILWISFEDFFFWTAAGVWFFLRLCQENNGIIRGYILLGIALGAWVYYRLCSRPLMHRLEKIINLIKNRLKKHKKAATIKIERLRNRMKSREAEKKDAS